MPQLQEADLLERIWAHDPMAATVLLGRGMRLLLVQATLLALDEELAGAHTGG